MEKLENTPSKEEQKYHEASTVNGIEISVNWDKGYAEYTIYFPQIELGEEASEQGVHDQVLRLNKDDDFAKEVYKKAVELAESADDAYDLYKKIYAFSKEADKE